MQNRSGLLLCVLALLMGFLMVCLGAFFISRSSTFSCQESLIVAYLLLPLGFVILLSGIFWSNYRQVTESKEVFRHVLGQHLAHGALPLATVDRPDFYPPAYEESLEGEKQSCPAEREASGNPPPPYTETGLEFQDGNYSYPEAPPSYRESIAGLVVTATSEDAQRRDQEC
ncbi:transmembrane protein 252 [Callithrix jacchus]|uniref:Transmembrane protein 252 n=1 Tax=Callithrix jacchus TaxID=9483 RepID=A0A2R8M5B6_CALJA|nr:transmembrane protein 252 [Callithrix jacchus]